MATSEFLRNESSAKRGPGPVSQLPVSGKGVRTGATATMSAAMIAGDTVTMLLAFGVAVALRVSLAARLAPESGMQLRDYWAQPTDLVYLVWFMAAYLLVARRYGLYASVPSINGYHELRLVLQGCLTAGLLLCGSLYVFRAIEVSRILVVLMVTTSCLMLSIRRHMWRRSRYRQFEQGIELRNVVILGTSQLSYAMARELMDRGRLGCRFVGFIARPGLPVNKAIAPEQVLGGLERIRALTRQHFVDEVVLTEFWPTDDVIRLVQDARDLDIDVRAIAGYYGDLAINAPVEYLGIFPVATLHRRRRRAAGLICKRVVDVALSLVALFATAPLLIAIAVAVRLESEGPALYVSSRIGKRGRVFPCFKFRTMVKNAEKMKHELTSMNERDGILFKCSNDPRVTRLGRFLRKYSLDELPQFLNVLRGEMSIVGPRPPIASEVEKYELEHFRRLEVTPGLTGLWQVQARHDPSFARYIELDTAYVENWSFWLDLKILLRTAGVVLQGTGV
jgi:exopolysaccharide biosynthesis polyprenyl glycosylphosphotransferase